jgi:hypothetical protein
VALVDWRQRSIKALETTLDWLVDFLSPAGVLVVWVDPQEPAGNRKLRRALEAHGLIVEPGAIREHGCGIGAAARHDPELQGRVSTKPPLPSAVGCSSPLARRPGTRSTPSALNVTGWRAWGRAQLCVSVLEFPPSSGSR